MKEIVCIPLWNIYINRSFETTVSQLKICDFFQEKRLKILKCYNFLWVQRRHNCSPVACFANCIMTLYLLKVHLQTFLSIPVTQKCQIWSCDTLVANERYVNSTDTRGQKHYKFWFWSVNVATMQEKKYILQANFCYCGHRTFAWATLTTQ